MKSRKTVNMWHDRSLLKSAIRDFFKAHEYLEIDTPILVECPGTEVHLQYFQSEWKSLDQRQRQVFLRSSPELEMKRAMAESQLKRVFQFAPSFRNHGELADWHHPEFTMLEWYHSGMGYKAFMQFTEDLVKESAKKFYKMRKQKATLDLRNKFPRFDLYDLFEEIMRFPLIDLDEELTAKAIAAGMKSVRPSDDFETSFFKILLDRVEPFLKTQKTAFVYNYPESMAALAQTSKGRAQRFELYIDGIEIANAFHEILSVAENEKRIAAEMKKRKALGYTVNFTFNNFLKSLGSGLKPCSGNALGFDRLLACLMGYSGIAKVIPFREDYL